jgi:hypothetical protein
MNKIFILERIFLNYLKFDKYFLALLKPKFLFWLFINYYISSKIFTTSKGGAYKVFIIEKSF